MKRFIELWLSNFKWARKLHGGKWVKRIYSTPRTSAPGEWVTWNEPEDSKFCDWPLPEEKFICEEYR